MSNEIIFINGKSKCGCEMEFSDGGGEYSDVHIITPCAEHSCPESALLQRIADLETQKTDLMEHVLNAYEASALTMTLRKTVGYLPDYLRFCGIYGVEHDAIIDKLDYQSFVLARVNNEDLRQDEAACSLVAENEELKRRIAELESKNGNLRTIAHEQNGLAIRANLDSINDAAEMDGLQKRIAELEARTVTLPPTFWYEHDDLSRDVPVLDKRLVKKAIRAAGIKVKED